MTHAKATEFDTPPSHRPGVGAAITQLEETLRQLLGAGTRYVLVIAVDKGDRLDVQAVTDTSAGDAMALLRYAQATGFDSVQ